MNATPITEQTVFEILSRINDPELGCNIVDLGLVYSVGITGSTVTVVMTLTTPGCPMHESICRGAQEALLAIEGVEQVDVQLVWEPPWHPSMMTAAGREMLGIQEI